MNPGSHCEVLKGEDHELGPWELLRSDLPATHQAREEGRKKAVSEIPRLAVQNYFNPATITINLVQFLKPCPVEDQRGNTGHINTQLLKRYKGMLAYLLQCCCYLNIQNRITIKCINTEAGRQSWSLAGSCSAVECQALPGLTLIDLNEGSGLQSQRRSVPRASSQKTMTSEGAS
ncbi:uncharacterized protein WM277_025943 isoform 1-T1 [Molossus nigricans]